jgi:hypothetical protein
LIFIYITGQGLGFKSWEEMAYLNKAEAFGKDDAHFSKRKSLKGQSI